MLLALTQLKLLCFVDDFGPMTGQLRGAARPRQEQFIGVYLTTEAGNKPKRVYRKATVDLGPFAR